MVKYFKKLELLQTGEGGAPAVFLDGKRVNLVSLELDYKTKDCDSEGSNSVAVEYYEQGSLELNSIQAIIPQRKECSVVFYKSDVVDIVDAVESMKQRVESMLDSVESIDREVEAILDHVKEAQRLSDWDASIDCLYLAEDGLIELLKMLR